MNVSYFIGISSAVLLTWLGVTYFHQVPHEPYPKQNRISAATAKMTTAESTQPLNANIVITE